MALATKAKPKTHQKKRQAQHHRRGKHYMKAYLPYLPMFAIVGLGALVNRVWTSPHASVATLNPGLATTRIGLVTGNPSSNLLYISLAVTFVAFAIFIIMHWYRVQRLLNRGEAFMVHHPWFDIGLVFIVTTGVVLTRT